MEVVVYSITEHLPVYYRTFPGNQSDARTIDIIIADLKEVGFPDFILLMDRAYHSLKNIDKFIRDDVKIVACMKAGVRLALTQITSLGIFDFVPTGFTLDEELNLYVAQYDLQRTIKMEDGTEKQANKLKLNLYFDPVRRSRTLMELDKSREDERKELDEIISKKSHFTYNEMIEITEKNELFNLKWKNVRVPVEECPEYAEDEYKKGRKKKYISKYMFIEHKRDDQALMNMKKTADFRALVTLGVDFNASEAMRHYSLRSEQEIDNEQWKSLFPCDREHNSSEAGKAGASFIQFVGRIMSCTLEHYWRSNLELRKMFKSSLSIIDEMRRIKCV